MSCIPANSPGFRGSLQVFPVVTHPLGTSNFICFRNHPPLLFSGLGPLFLLFILLFSRTILLNLTRGAWRLSFSLNIPVSGNAFWGIFGSYSWSLSLMTFSQCKDFYTSPDFCTLERKRWKNGLNIWTKPYISRNPSLGAYSHSCSIFVCLFFCALVCWRRNVPKSVEL